MKTKTKLARLTREEDALYCNMFAYYMGNVRANTLRADAYAWRQCVQAHPRLKSYTGAGAFSTRKP